MIGIGIFELAILLFFGGAFLSAIVILVLKR